MDLALTQQDIYEFDGFHVHLYASQRSLDACRSTDDALNSYIHLNGTVHSSKKKKRLIGYPVTDKRHLRSLYRSVSIGYCSANIVLCSTQTGKFVSILPACQDCVLCLRFSRDSIVVQWPMIFDFGPSLEKIILYVVIADESCDDLIVISQLTKNFS